MKIFKITNITNQAGKRDYKFNTILNIEYIDEMIKKSIKVKPNETIYLTTESLLLSVQKMRINGQIIISEISEAELIKSMNDAKPKNIEKPIGLVDESKKNTNKKNVFEQKKKR